MKRNNFLIKLIVLIVFVSMISCFMVGCDKEDVLDNNGDGGKAVNPRATFFHYAIVNEGRICDFDEDIEVVLYYGTKFTKKEIDSLQSQEDGKTHSIVFQASQVDGNKLTPFGETVQLFEINDFCKENYPPPPYIGSGNKVILPKELFAQQNGIVLIWYYITDKEHYPASITLYYSNNNGIISFTRFGCGEFDYEE